MQISKLNACEKRIIADNHSLAAYLSSLERGRAATPHSWLYEDESSEKTLDRWLHILEQLNGGSEVEKLIYQFDLKQLEKFGPQGKVPPISEAIKVESFQEQFVPTEWKKPEPLNGLDHICHIRPRSINYRSFDAVIDDMAARDTLSTNSGWPLFARRNSVTKESITQAADGSAWKFPAIILFRQYNGKLRVVWMYPMAMNLLEYTVTQPLQEAILSSTRYVEPWKGFEFVKQRFTELWAEHPYAFGGDTTSMDAHMQYPQLNRVATGCAPLFKDPQLLIDTLKHVAEIDIIVGPDAIIRNQRHGIASGSGWTQLSETIFQMQIHDAYCSYIGKRIPIDHGMGIGDDYVWFFDKKPDSESIVNFWARYGLPGKPEKQSNEDDRCTFLQRLFIKGYFSRDDSAVLGGIYPTIRALNSLLNPEKFHNPKQWNSDMFCVRCYMILENCVDHPLFEEFVKFVVKGQKDLLPFAKQSAQKINSAYIQARSINGLTPTYNQEKREKPLAEFSSIKFAATI